MAGTACRGKERTAAAAPPRAGATRRTYDVAFFDGAISHRTEEKQLTGPCPREAPAAQRHPTSPATLACCFLEDG